MIFLCAALGIFLGNLLNRLGDYLTRFASVPFNAVISTQPWFEPAALQLLAALTFKERSRLSRSLVSDAAVELFTASLFSYLWVRLGPSWNLVLVGLISAFLLLITVIDLRYRIILNVLLLPAALVVLLLCFTLREMNILSVLLGGAFGLAIFAFAAFIRPGELGGGDVKLAALIGLIFGFPHVIMPLLLGVLAGGIAVILLVLTRHGNRSSQIPYAPFLCLGALIALLNGPISSFSISP
jgi:prepilin signal peptidase PulO-like enzyme (type II secretory pathway)